MFSDKGYQVALAKPQGYCERCKATRYPEDGCLLENCEWKTMAAVKSATNGVRRT